MGERSRQGRARLLAILGTIILLAAIGTAIVSATALRANAALLPKRVYLPVLANGACLQVAPTVSVTPASQPYNPTEVDFTFQGACFTPNGQVTRWFVDPQGETYGLDPINADASGSFSRTLHLMAGWPVGTYSYWAQDVATGKVAMVQASITSASSGTSPVTRSAASVYSDRPAPFAVGFTPG